MHLIIFSITNDEFALLFDQITAYLSQRIHLRKKFIKSLFLSNYYI